MQISGQTKIWNKEVKQAQNGNQYTSFNVSISKKNQDGTYENGSIRATAHRYNHDKMMNIFDGDSVFYSGQLQPNNYEKNGQQVYSYQLLTSEIYKLEQQNNGNNNGYQNNNNGPSNFMNQAQQITTDELPF